MTSFWSNITLGALKLFEFQRLVILDSLYTAVAIREMYQNAPKPRVPRRPPPGRPAAAKPLVRSMSLPASMLPPPATATSRQLSRQSSFPASSEDDWQREVEEAYEEVVIKEHREVLFADVAEGHLHELPIVVELSRSLYGVCEDLTLTTGQKISVHFLKKTEVARVTGKRGSVLSVPINTSLRFSPMYEDVKEYSYASVKKLVSAKPPPLVVCVTEVCDPESSKSAPGILAGDILILKDGKRRAFLTGHVLWFNTRTYQDVRLNERCSMRFTAMSERTKLSLPVLLKHIGLPQMCFVYAGDNAQAAERRLIRRYFQEGICTLLCQNVESSFVASCIPEEMGGESRTLEIGTNFSIPVRILKTTGLPQQKLVEKSCELFWSFQPEMIDAFVGGEKEEPKAKLDLRKTVGKRGKMIGVTLVHPECLKPPASSHHDYGNLPFHTKREDERRPMETCK